MGFIFKEVITKKLKFQKVVNFHLNNEKKFGINKLKLIKHLQEK